jgi:hypothetical protein
VRTTEEICIEFGVPVLAPGQVGKARCPICGPDRRHQGESKSRTLKYWDEIGRRRVVFFCHHCKRRIVKRKDLDAP